MFESLDKIQRDVSGANSWSAINQIVERLESFLDGYLKTKDNGAGAFNLAS